MTKMKQALPLLALASAALPSTAAAADAPSCVPTGGKVVQKAGTTTVWQYERGPLIACGDFGKQLELAPGYYSNFWDSENESRLLALSDRCAVVTREGGSSRYQSLDSTVKTIDLAARVGASTSFSGSSTSDVAASRAIVGPSCSAAFEIGTPARVRGIDSRGETQAPEGVSLDEYATGLQGPVKGLGPVRPSRPSSRFSSVVRLTKSRLTLQYGSAGSGEYPQGITVLVAGRVVRVPSPNDAADPKIQRRILIPLGSAVSARLKAGRRYRVEVISCALGCISQVRTLRVAP